MSGLAKPLAPRRLITAAILPAVVFGLLLVAGVDLVHCVVLASGVLLLLELRRLPDVDDGPSWPDRPGRIVDDRGVRREVAHLSWSLPGLHSRVDRRLVDRLRGIADGRLTAYGVDLRETADADRLQALLGDPAYRTLTIGLWSRPSFAEFEHAVSAVERLADQGRRVR